MGNRDLKSRTDPAAALERQVLQAARSSPFTYIVLFTDWSINGLE